MALVEVCVLGSSRRGGDRSSVVSSHGVSHPPPRVVPQEDGRVPHKASLHGHSLSEWSSGWGVRAPFVLRYLSPATTCPSSGLQDRGRGAAVRTPHARSPHGRQAMRASKACPPHMAWMAWAVIMCAFAIALESHAFRRPGPAPLMLCAGAAHTRLMHCLHAAHMPLTRCSHATRAPLLCRSGAAHLPIACPFRARAADLPLVALL